MKTQITNRPGRKTRAARRDDQVAPWKFAMAMTVCLLLVFASPVAISLADDSTKKLIRVPVSVRVKPDDVVIEFTDNIAVRGAKEKRLSVAYIVSHDPREYEKIKGDITTRVKEIVKLLGKLSVESESKRETLVEQLSIEVAERYGAKYFEYSRDYIPFVKSNPENPDQYVRLTEQERSAKHNELRRNLLKKKFRYFKRSGTGNADGDSSWVEVYIRLEYPPSDERSIKFKMVLRPIPIYKEREGRKFVKFLLRRLKPPASNSKACRFDESALKEKFAMYRSAHIQLAYDFYQREFSLPDDNQCRIILRETYNDEKDEEGNKDGEDKEDATFNWLGKEQHLRYKFVVKFDFDSSF